MIIISGELEIDESSESSLLPLVEPLVEGTRAESGCNTYAFSRDLHEPTLFRITEEWADEASLADHLKSEHYRAFGRALRDIEVKRMSIIQYSVEDRTVLV